MAGRSSAGVELEPIPDIEVEPLGEVCLEALPRVQVDLLDSIEAAGASDIQTHKRLYDSIHGKGSK